MSGCIIQSFESRMALLSPITGNVTEMICTVGESIFIPETKIVLGPEKLLDEKILDFTVSSQVTQADFLSLVYVRILKPSSRKAETWATKAVRLRLFIDKSCLTPNKVLDAPLGSLAAGPDKKYPATPFDFTQPGNFHALKWNEAAKKPKGNPLGFFLSNGAVLEAELHSNKALKGSVTLEIGVSLMRYKAAGF